jgi:hypothetical protein
MHAYGRFKMSFLSANCKSRIASQELQKKSFRQFESFFSRLKNEIIFSLVSVCSSRRWLYGERWRTSNVLEPAGAGVRKLSESLFTATQAGGANNTGGTHQDTY